MNTIYFILSGVTSPILVIAFIISLCVRYAKLSPMDKWQEIEATIKDARLITAASESKFSKKPVKKVSFFAVFDINNKHYGSKNVCINGNSSNSAILAIQKLRVGQKAIIYYDPQNPLNNSLLPKKEQSIFNLKITLYLMINNIALFAVSIINQVD